MPVIVRKTDVQKPPSAPSAAPSSAGSSRVSISVSTPVFVCVIVVALVVVGFLAFRAFGPAGNGGWDNTKTGVPPSASALSKPPEVARPGGGEAGQPAGTSEQPVGAELPPDVQ